MKTLRVKCDPDGISKAITIIQKGGTVVFPTDTVYGIGCNPYNKEAVKKIYKIKSSTFRLCVQCYQKKPPWIY